MRVLITGATGFVGRYIVRELLLEGYEVGCLVRNVEKTLRLFENKVRAYKVDFEDKGSLEKAFSDFVPDFLIHLIGILLEDRRRGQTFMRLHYLYAKNLYQVAKDYGRIKKVVHMSSLGTHKDAPSMYHRTKYMAEEELKRSGLNYTIMRPSIVLGPEQKLFYDMWHITKYIRLVALPGGGSYLFQPVDVRDVACAFAKALNLRESDGKVYELCGNKRVSFKELLKDIFRAWGRRVIFLPVPRVLMYFGGLLVERVVQPPPFSSDQMLMMWRDNVCGLDQEVESQGIQKLCGKEPIPYEESLRWSLEEFGRYVYA
ncbi:MAG: NAD-dependent epimerase/dehydratase family protein [Aquificaceae bacterium]